MKHFAIIVFLILNSITAQAGENVIISKTDGCISFVVDGNLMPVTTDYRSYDGSQIAEDLLSEHSIPTEEQQIVATSFEGYDNMMSMGKDCLFQTVYMAYARHHAITLSPDMIWLLICQRLARYVNTHAEEMRPLIVTHEGKIELEIKSEKDLLSNDADWSAVIDAFSSQIGNYTKNNIVETVTSGFSTTTVTERIATQITLMVTLKEYFDYTAVYAACGIPYISLKGTPDDWRQVFEKVCQLEKYGLAQWANSLKPIIIQFIQAAEGQPDRKFWRSMVKKNRVRKLKEANCSPKKPTKLDGWLLKFFPDENGNATDQVSASHSFDSDLLHVNFKYRVIDPSNTMIASEYPMELWAGFIGTEFDSANNMLIPKIGWLVRKDTDQEDITLP